MSLSDKFYEGLSAPLPVAGAQMPTDLVPYAGGPLDALEQHNQKYKQIDYMNRLSDKASKRLLKQLADAETDYEVDDMDKVGFVGTNPLSRRAYFMQKLAERPAPAVESIPDTIPDPIPAPAYPAQPAQAPAPVAEQPGMLRRGYNWYMGRMREKDRQRAEFRQKVYDRVGRVFRDEPTKTPVSTPAPEPVQATVASTPQTPFRRAQQVATPRTTSAVSAQASSDIKPIRGTRPYDLKGFGDQQKADPAQLAQREARNPTPPKPTPGPAYSAQYNQGHTRFVGDGAQGLGDSGDVARRLGEFGSAIGQYRKEKYVPRERERGFFDNLMHNVEHYGTRAARGLSTAAQMGASKLYDVANEGGYLADDSFIGRNISRKNRESLNREMADINASLYHAYGGAGNQANSGVYAQRFRDMDMDLGTIGIQGPQNDLLDANRFREDQILRQLRQRSDFNRLTPDQRANLERGIADRINNFYGFDVDGSPNRLGTGRISDDLDGTAFNRALRESGNQLMTDPRNILSRTETLNQMLRDNPAMAASLEARFGEEAQKAGLPLATYVANQVASGLDPRLALVDAGAEGIEDDIYETDEQRSQRYENSRRITQDILGSMSPENQAQFIRSINPAVVQRAEEINALMESDPQRALSEINAMDPLEAKYLLDQISMFSQYISPETAGRVMDYDNYRISEDDENFFGGLFNLGGSDIVNRARQQVGAGGNIDDLTGAARDRVFGYNSMRDTPRGRFYLAERGNLGDTFFNPETGEVNYELGGDMVGGGVNDRLPPEYLQQYRDAVGAENSGLRDDYYLVDDGYMGNYYYNPYSGDRNYEFLYGNPLQFQDKPLPQQFHEQYRKQFNRSPSYRG